MVSTKILSALGICIYMLVICTPVESTLVESLVNSYTAMAYIPLELCLKSNSDGLEYQKMFNDAVICYHDTTNNNHSACNCLEQNVQKCFEPIVDYLENCLPEESKYISKVFKNQLVAAVQEFYGSTEEVLLELGNPCIYDFLLQQNGVSIKTECKIEILKFKLSKFDDEVPSKCELCQYVREIGNCWLDHVNEQCDSPNAKEMFSKFYNVLVSPCKEF